MTTTLNSPAATAARIAATARARDAQQAPTPFRGREHWIARTRIDTPLGAMTAVATRHGLAGLWFDGQAHHPGVILAPEAGQHPLFLALRDQLADYWSGTRQHFNLPLDPQGTPFQSQVWEALQMIPSGHAVTYGDVARGLGQATAARAVGAAVGRNPISIIVPCHRVLGQGGALTGYAGGLARKQALLRLEGAGSASSEQPHLI